MGVLQIPESSMERLRDAARAASALAYCPYSHFRVGAAVLTDDGAIASGCNVENASYGLTICAERAAIFAAVAGRAGEDPPRIVAVAVYTPTPTPTAPCGACRQVINEFGPDATIHAFCDGAEILDRSLADLLPDAFGPRNLAGSPSSTNRDRSDEVEK